MACILNDQPDIVLLGKVDAGNHIGQPCDVDRVADVEAEFAWLRPGRVGVARLILGPWETNFPRVRVTGKARVLACPTAVSLAAGSAYWATEKFQAGLRCAHESALNRPSNVPPAWQTLPMGTVAMSRPSTVRFKLLHSLSDGHPTSPGMLLQEEPAAAAPAAAPSAATNSPPTGLMFACPQAQPHRADDVFLLTDRTCRSMYSSASAPGVCWPAQRSSLQESSAWQHGRRPSRVPLLVFRVVSGCGILAQFYS